MDRYTFDPDGDVLLTLQATETSGNIDASGLGHIDQTCRKRKRDSDTDEASEAVPSCRTGPSYEMLVSSRHLALSSTVFKAMLQPHFAEGAALQKIGTFGHVTIPLGDDDPYAMAVIMTIIHNQPKKVPTRISLQQLTHIAVAVDKYDCKDAVDYFAQIWVKDLENHKFPENTGYPNPCTGLLPWLCISWVFKISSLFRKSTKIAIHHSEGPILEKPGEGYPEDLPIPPNVFEKIEQARIDGIKGALSVLDEMIQMYQDNRFTHCSGSKKSPSKRCLTPEEQISAKICDCATLGGLIKSACISKMYPAPSPPFHPWTYAKMAEKIESIGMMVPSYCLELNKASKGLLGSEVTCHILGRTFEVYLNYVTIRLHGLDLESVLSKSNP